MRHIKTLLTVLGAVTVLVLATNTIALATTGHAFILGKANSANRITSLSRTTAGSALSLHTTSSGAAPLAVNGHGKVTNLNADMVDGLDSSALKTTAYVFKTDVTVATSSVSLTIPVPNGHYVVSYSAYLNGAQTQSVDCYLEQQPKTGSSVFSGESRFTAGASTPGLSATGFMTMATGGALRLHCIAASGTWTTFGDEPIQIVATRVDTVAANGTIAPRKVSPRTR